MSDLFFIIIGTVFINNLIVDEIVGTDPALALIRRHDVAWGLSITMLILLPSVTLVTYLVELYLLEPMALAHFRLLVFTGLILAIMPGLNKCLAFFDSRMAEQPVIFLPLVGINTAVLGTALLNQQVSNSLARSIAFGLGAAIGFGLIMVIITAISERISMADVPGPFRGSPVILITLGIISISFMGFTGIIK